MKFSPRKKEKEAIISCGPMNFELNLFETLHEQFNLLKDFVLLFCGFKVYLKKKIQQSENR
jgi:hypothetical protein